MSFKGELDRFGQLFKQHLGGAVQATLRWVTAEKIDWNNKTMTASGEDDLEYFDVLLGVGMTSVKPVVGTDCLIAIIEGDNSTAFMLYADEAELIQLNDGDNGGLTVTPKLKTALDKNNVLLQAILSVILGVSIPEPGNGSPSALQAALKTAVSGKQLGDFSEIENTKIVH